MNIKNLALVGAALLLSSPVFGATYYGGFEDTRGTTSDYDYNDVVFALSGSGLKLISSDSFYMKPSIDQSGAPFWNNTSYDGLKTNIGDCIYGGGNCGAGIDPTAMFLASNPTSTTGSANNVTFSVSGDVNTKIELKISAAPIGLGYYLTSDPTHAIQALTPAVAANTYTFSPGGDFGLVGLVNGDIAYYSQTFLGTSDDVSHFAFFSTNAPEPGVTSLMGAGLIGIAAVIRRRRKVAN